MTKAKDKAKESRNPQSDRLRLLSQIQTGICMLTASSVLLGVLKLIQWISGLEEQEFYKQYPASWYVVVVLGVVFVSGLFYLVLKILRAERMEP